MNEFLESFGLVQHLSEPTQERGGILDVVITSIDQPPTSVSVDDVSISDHMLLTWPVKLVRPSPMYVTTSRRNWKYFNFELFVRQLEQSELCHSPQPTIVADGLAERFKVVIMDILDRLAPARTITVKERNHRHGSTRRFEYLDALLVVLNASI